MRTLDQIQLADSLADWFSAFGIEPAWLTAHAARQPWRAVPGRQYRR